MFVTSSYLGRGWLLVIVTQTGLDGGWLAKVLPETCGDSSFKSHTSLPDFDCLSWLILWLQETGRLASSFESIEGAFCKFPG